MPRSRPVRQQSRPLLAALEPRLLFSTTFVPVADHALTLLDSTRNELLIAQSTGFIQRFHLDTQTFDSPIALGYVPKAWDISPDGHYLYVTAPSAAPLILTINEINLVTGAITPRQATFTDLPHRGTITLNSTYATPYDIAVKSNGEVHIVALLASVESRNDEFIFHPGDAALTMLAAGIQATGLVPPSITKNADATILGTSWSAPNVSYLPSQVSFAFSGHSIQVTEFQAAALSLDGRQAIILNGSNYISFYNADTKVAELRSFTVAGIALDDLHHRLYIADNNASTPSIRFFEVSDFAHPAYLGAIPVPSFQAADALFLSPDDTTLFYNTSQGIQEVDLAAFSVASLSISSIATYASTPVAFALKICNFDGTLNVAYQGIVHFTSTDPTAVLPADYTFTLAEAGVRTFFVTPATLGKSTLSLTASGVITGAATLQLNVIPSTTSAISALVVSPNDLTATVSGPAGQPLAGSVELREGTATLASAILTAGKATFDPTAISTLYPGRHAFTLHYSGNGPYAASDLTSIVYTRPRVVPILSQSISGATLIASGTNTGFGSFLLLEGTTLLDAKLQNSDNAQFYLWLISYTVLPPGPHTLTLRHVSDIFSESADLIFTYSRPKPDPRLTITQGTYSHFLSVGVSDIASQPLDGTVELRNGTALLATLPLTNGGARFDLSSLTPDVQYQLTAHYSGNADYAPGDMTVSYKFHN